MNDSEKQTIVFIPRNFIEKGTFMGGMFKIRNAIEGGILAVLIAVPVIQLPLSLTVRIIILCMTALPAAMISLIGIGGESISAVFQISSTQTLDHPHPPPLLFMFNSGRLISIAVILCRIYFYSGKLSPFYGQWIIPTDQSIVLSGILATASGIWFVSGICFTAQYMGIRHPLSYNIRIKNVRNYYFRCFLRFKNVSEVNLYETETNSLPILWQYSNFKRCFLCIWK